MYQDVSTGIIFFCYFKKDSDLIFQVNVNYFVFYNSSTKKTQEDYQLNFLA